MLAACVALTMAAGACAGADESSTTTVAEPTTTAAASDATTSTTVEGGAEDPADIEWVQHEGGEGCGCADGSDFHFWSRTADPERVVLYFMGGGACFSAETCAFTGGTYTSSIAATMGDGSGIFDFSNPANPLRDWSVVVVPYCTGDVHIGTAVHRYSDDLEVAHVGFVNASSALDHLVASFPDAQELFVSGSSAGGVPAPLFGGLAADALPDAAITVLADGSGAFPDNPPVNAAIGGLWGTFDAVPDWPENEGLTPEDWSIPALFVQAGLHAPEVRMARFDNAYDDVQAEFSRLSKIGGGDQREVTLGNEAGIEAAGVPIHRYLAPGTDHTILGSDALYTLEVEGVSFLDWLTRYVGGEDVEDVTCSDCGNPGAPDDG